jgi:sugar/nucleoside kinase (ribokinase family)
MKAAKAQGAICSFDLNYRAKLWATMGGLEKAQEVGGQIASLCDVLVGNEEDLQLGLVSTKLTPCNAMQCKRSCSPPQRRATLTWVSDCVRPYVGCRGCRRREGVEA